MKQPKPCPICGNNGAVMRITVWPKTLRRYAYQCELCGHRVRGRLTKGGARRAWNRQTNVKKIEEVHHEQ